MPIFSQEFFALPIHKALGALLLTSALALSGCSKPEQTDNRSTRITLTPAVPVSEQIDELPPILDTNSAALEKPLTDAVAEPALSSSNNGMLAIIIDDIGYNQDTGLRAAKLASTITLSVLPFSPNGSTLAETGVANGKEIMLHAPMSTINPRPLDKGGLTENMAKEEFVNTLFASLDTLTDVRGVNNHMGSLLTQKDKQMHWLMDALKSRAMYFVDSRTIANSRAYEVAQATDIPSAKRDIFLDNERSEDAIARQLRQAIKHARLHGQAIAIGHPYPETMNVLETLLPQMAAEQNVSLVRVSEIVERPPAALITMSKTQKEDADAASAAAPL